MALPRRSLLDQEISELHTNLFRLADMVDEAIHRGVTAFRERNATLAQQVIEQDKQLNLLRYQLEQDCLRLLATQQPAARDLRHVLAIIHITIELERMGDHAAGIAALVKRLSESEPPVSMPPEPVSEDTAQPTSPPPLSYHKLFKMSNRARQMLRDSMSAFVQRDAQAAQQVIRQDDKLDRRYAKLFRKALEDMQNGTPIQFATYLLWVGHSLERIGDRATNIAERVIFMVSGQYAELESYYNDAGDALDEPDD